MGIGKRKPETGNPGGLRAGFGRADITPGYDNYETADRRSAT